ncbi:MAG: hypothetical protein WD845_14220 [Pirellulales bacterium]
MRSRTAHAAILFCLALGLAGCSTTNKSSGKSWWQSLSFKSKSKTESLASSNAPAAPSFGSTASPTVSMPPAGYAGSAAPAGATQYPVTPYPPTTVPAAQGAYAANTAPAGGYMPPSDPYATAAAGYGAPQGAANPYLAANAAPQTTAYAQQANPYATPAAQQAPAYTASEQYNAYQAAPAAPGTTPYTYR